MYLRAIIVNKIEIFVMKPDKRVDRFKWEPNKVAMGISELEYKPLKLYQITPDGNERFSIDPTTNN